jgi:hypothetical protein
LFLLTWTWGLGRNWERVLPVMWTSLNCGRPAYAVWRVTGFGSSGSRWWYWIWVWNFYNFGFLRRGSKQFPSGSYFEVVVAVCFLWAWSVWLIWHTVRWFVKRGKPPIHEWDSQAKVWRALRSSASSAVHRIYERRLISEFREIVREPLPDPSDPRFQAWDVSERFPPGWGLAQYQLHERLARRLNESP